MGETRDEWTRNVPTEPGWYWFHNDNLCTPIPVAVRVIRDPLYETPTVEVMFFPEPHDATPSEWHDADGYGQDTNSTWYGPIALPLHPPAETEQKP